MNMSRNSEAHFRTNPTVNKPRSVFDLSHGHATSLKIGRVIPMYYDFLYPGDSVSMNVRCNIRLQTLATPVMGDIYADTYWFAVPCRILWKHWKQFMGENDKSSWYPDTEYNMPQISAPSGGFAPGTIADYLGVPPGVPFNSSSKVGISSLPFRAYAKVCNHFFRDENVQDPILIHDDDSDIEGSNGDDQVNDIERGGMPYKACKLHSRFTTVVPSPQKGPAVSLFSANPEAFRLPVIAQNDRHNSSGVDVTFHSNNKNANLTGTMKVNSSTHALLLDSTTADRLTPDNLYAVAGANTVGANIDINTLRLSFALQHYYEIDAQYGSRYAEMIYGHFGVTNPDSRMQDPEYIGGHRFRLNITTVANTAQTESDALGDVGANSATFDEHFDFDKAFTEHTILLGVVVLRYDHTYSQGLDKSFTISNRFELYDPAFANLGYQPVRTSEIYNDATSITNDDVFGYAEAWSELRTRESRVSGLMRPGVQNSLGNVWTFADVYQSPPTLSPGWITEDPNNLERVLYFDESTSDPAWADFWFTTKYTRCMPMFSQPATIGRF